MVVLLAEYFNISLKSQRLQVTFAYYNNLLQRTQNGHVFSIVCRNDKLLCCYCMFALGKGELPVSFTKVQLEPDVSRAHPGQPSSL